MYCYLAVIFERSDKLQISFQKVSNDPASVLNFQFSKSICRGSGRKIIWVRIDAKLRWKYSKICCYQNLDRLKFIKLPKISAPQMGIPQSKLTCINPWLGNALILQLGTEIQGCSAPKNILKNSYKWYN